MRKIAAGVLVSLSVFLACFVWAPAAMRPVHAQQHLQLTLDAVDTVRDYYFEYATQNGWQILNDLMRERAMAEVRSHGPFVETASRLYTPRVLWVERMAVADYYFQDFAEAEEEFYSSYYVNPTHGVLIKTFLIDSNPNNLRDSSLEFIVRDSAGNIYRDWDVLALPDQMAERTILGVTLYYASYDLLVFGDFTEVDSIELFIFVDGLMTRAEHRWLLQ